MASTPLRRYRFVTRLQANKDFSTLGWQNQMGQIGIGCQVALSDNWWTAPQSHVYLDIVFDSEADVALFALVHPAQFNNLEQVI